MSYTTECNSSDSSVTTYIVDNDLHCYNKPTNLLSLTSITDRQIYSLLLVVNLHLYITGWPKTKPQTFVHIFA